MKFTPQNQPPTLSFYNSRARELVITAHFDLFSSLQSLYLLTHSFPDFFVIVTNAVVNQRRRGVDDYDTHKMQAEI